MQGDVSIFLKKYLNNMNLGTFLKKNLLLYILILSGKICFKFILKCSIFLP